MPPKQNKKPKILVVDDEELIRDMIDEYLSTLGYKVIQSENGKKGLEIIKREKVDVVISDFKMPDLTGTQFLEIINKEYPDTVRILMTGYPDIVNAKDAINKCGVFKYLVKPIDLEELKESIEFSIKYLVSQRTKSKRLVQLEEDLNRLIQLSLAFANETNIDNLLGMIVYEAKNFCDADTAILYLRKDDNLVVKDILTSSLKKEYVDKHLSSTITVDGQLIPQFVAKTGEILRIEDVSSFEFKNIVDIKSDFMEKSDLHVKTVLGIPVKNNVFQTLGVIELVNKAETAEDEESFNERDEEIVRSLSSLAGASLQNLQLINDLQEINDRKSKFLTILGHELRTPVAILSEYVNILAEGNLDDEETKNHLFSTSIKNIEHLKELVEGIINIAKKDYKVQFEQVSIKSTIKKALNTFYSAIKERNLSIQISKGDDLTLEAEPGKLLMVFKNLISNAIKYTPDGGVIKFIIKRMDYIAEIVIQDTGIGIPKDKLEKIFEGFHNLGDESIHSTSKTKFLGGGIGLGLYISRQIIEEHKGKIWAESEGKDKGSRFIINMPVTQS